MKVLIWGLGTKFGGVEKYVFDRLPYLNNVNSFDFAYPGNEIIDYLDKIDLHKSNIFHTHRLQKPIRYFFSIYRLVQKQHYDIVYCNLAFSNIIFFLAVKAAGAKLVVHSHNTQIDVPGKIKQDIFNVYHYISRLFGNNLIDKKFACSIAAGKWLFGDSSFQIRKNAIDSNIFVYDPEVRKVVRDKLQINDNEFVIGHDGRFSYQKNQEFLVNLFNVILRIYPKSKLLLIGDGEDKNKIKNQCRELGIEGRVIFLGFRNDVSNLMQAMDCFILPSRFEGLGIAGIEAQAADLPCFFSDTITDEVKITPNVHFFSLNDSLYEIAKNVLLSAHYTRKNNQEIIINNGYDLSTQMKSFDLL